MRRNTRITILALVMGTTLVACGGSNTKTVETPDGKITVNKDDQSVTVKSEDGSATFGGASVPDDFPSNVPLPEDAKPQTVVTSGNSFQLGYEVDKSDLEAAVSDYKSALEDAGFTMGDGGSISAGGGSFSGFQATGKGYMVTVSGIGASTGSILAVGVTKDE